MAKFRNYSFGNIMLIASRSQTLLTLPDTELGLRLAASSGVAKKAFSFSPNVGNKRNKDENAEQNTDAKESQRTLYGFRVCMCSTLLRPKVKSFPH